jgi:Uma2 family endonuclease
VLLLIEVAESSLRKGRRIKSGIYAENGVPEYWVFDLRTKAVFVHTRPEDGQYAKVLSGR